MPQRTEVRDPPSRFRVRSMRRQDLDQVMILRKEEGVHDVRSCVQTFMEVDPDGMKVVVNEDGKVIGTCCATKQCDDFYLIGLYCVRKEYRRLGMGLNVWKACMEHIGSSNVVLNAVPSSVGMYLNKSGFHCIETEFTCAKNFTTWPVDPKNLSHALPDEVHIESFEKSHLPLVFQYDFELMGYRRERVLQLSCQEENSRTLVAFKEGRCVGFGSIKLSCLGAGKVGPLYADDARVAEVLLRSLIVSSPNRSGGFAMMTISSNASAKGFLKKLGCPEVMKLTRLYRREVLMDVDTDKVYALFCLNFAIL